MSVPNIHEIAVKRKIEAKRLSLDNVESNMCSSLAGSKFTSESEEELGIARPRHMPTDVTPTPANVTTNPRPRPVSATYYYGINIPYETQDSDVSQRCLHVYTDKLEALNVVKQHKKARFKIFKTREEAADFASNADLDLSSTYNAETLDNIRPTSCPSSPNVYEKPSIFKGPKAQELVKLRKSIECGDLLMVQTVIWENPRYLISSGDTPAILQEGSRYNALHVAAKAKNADITELILKTVGNPEFIGLLYGDDSLINSQDRAHILLDLYLNTPDKGLNETPLHFAVKYGASEVVDVLVSSKQCDRQLKNKYGQTPKDIVCSRVNLPDACLKEEIYNMLDERFYVPVMRSEDNTVQPTVGKPFSPITCPPELNDNPLDSRLEIRAFAGPMNQQQADNFHKKWKTPPRVKQPILNPWRLTDSEKGLEREGRDLAQQLKVGWKEYWKFLDTFVDFSSLEGLQILENYLQKRYLLKSFSDSPLKKDSTEGLQLSKTENVAFSKDSLDFDKDSSVLKDPTSPMTDLCISLQACSLSTKSKESTPLKWEKEDSANGAAGCQKGESIGRRHANQEEDALLSILTTPGLSPFLYVEKSCQVFGKRIADGLTHIGISEMGGDAESIIDFLKQEIKHLQSLVNSYMDDPRFISVDFHLVHSRISSIVVAKLSKLSPEEFDVIFDICSRIEHGKVNSLGSSDDEDLNVKTSTYRNQSCTIKKKKADDAIYHSQVNCIAQFIFSGLKSHDESFQTKNDTDNILFLTEEDCIKIWSDAVRCCCHWQKQNFTRNNRKGSSYNRLKYTASKENSLTKNEFAGIDRFRYINSESLACAGNKLSNLTKDDCVTLFPNDVDDDSEEEAFYTASSSPDCGTEESSDDEMESPDEGESVFIEGSTPTPVDLSVLQAIDECNISPTKYPNVYRWRHSVLLYPAEERVRWSSLFRSTGSQCMATPESNSQIPTDSFSRHEYWHRVVPPSSPLSPQFKKERKKRF